MLESAILSAIKSAKLAVSDLAIAAKLVQKTLNAYVPGTAPTSVDTLHNIQIVFAGYGIIGAAAAGIKTKELDNERIKSDDAFVIVFPETGTPVPQISDVIRITTTGKDVVPGDYRVVDNNKYMVGGFVGLSHVQMRKM